MTGWSGLPINGSHFSLGLLGCIINRFTVLIRRVCRTIDSLVRGIVDRRFTVVDLMVDIALGVLVDRLLIISVLVKMCRSCRRRRLIVDAIFRRFVVVILRVRRVVLVFGVDRILPRGLVTHPAFPSCRLVSGSVDAVVIGVVVLLLAVGGLFLAFVTYHGKNVIACIFDSSKLY